MRADLSRACHGNDIVRRISTTLRQRGTHMKVVNALVGAAVLSIGTAAMAQNTGVLLTDGDAQFRFGSLTSTTLFPTSNTSSSRLSIDHRINGGAGGIDHGFDMQWYLGIEGRTREWTLSGFTSRTTVGTNQVTYSFSNAFGVVGLGASVTATLIDGAFGANTSQVVTFLTLTNNSSAALNNFDAFFSVDNDIGATFGNDTFAALAFDNGNRVIVQSDAIAAGGPYHSTLFGYGADASGAGSFSALNTHVTDTGADFTTLADLGSAGNTTVGDYAQMMQWRRSLGVGESVTLRADIVGSIGATAVIPAPGALALLGLGGLVAGRRRR